MNTDFRIYVEQNIYSALVSGLTHITLDRRDVEWRARCKDSFKVREMILYVLENYFGEDYGEVSAWFDRFNYYMKIPYVDGLADDLISQTQEPELVGTYNVSNLSYAN